jgi:hypothetical protein
MKGFTLIELLLYIGIFIIIFVFTIGFFWNIIFGNIKETNYQEVQENGRFVLMKITQEIKKASAINSPIFSFSSSTLSLAMKNASSNPEIIDLSDGKIRVKKGASVPYDLNSSRVKIASLKFTNISYPLTPGTIKIELIVENIDPQYKSPINLESTVSLLPGGAN